MPRADACDGHYQALHGGNQEAEMKMRARTFRGAEYGSIEPGLQACRRIVQVRWRLAV